MNNAVELLMHEHEIIQDAQKAIEQLNELWKKDENTFTGQLLKLLDFFKNYADKYHHYKEEQVIFPYICNHPDFVLQEMIEEFKLHHEDFREYASEIKEELENKNYDKAYGILKTYFSDLQDHIAAENEELFVLIENLLTDDELEMLYFKCLDIDRELGESLKKQYENVLT